ncbi:MAG: bifunctional [glutamine synthetase] adenylyltransferase/[glutamine synthetase]-adenylyl-L-tyrosine phosphorylase [Kutzneria sp.]|nr:bifunctional [glutamine synthetase] adenylyltransferase/[glutamine synthetase]-adenylyl-L-tyrosine phosphorylase [Kutzneria sp.]MBV9844182.1 bifunctional [glutamine synthetase] adenylyltransferase/[glutamine synthetase]-adenylyl-L-tyrosine phosphorylase [Kutzneria sp.]
MTDPPRAASSPARFGLTDPQAEAFLRGCGCWADSGPVDGFEPILGGLSRCPDPDLALYGLDRLRTATGTRWPTIASALCTDSELRGRLLAVLGSSTALSDFLVANPDQWHRLASEAGARGDPADVMLAAVAGLRGAAAVRALRLTYRGLLLDVAAADLGHLVQPEMAAPRYEDTVERLSDLAAGALRAALAVAAAETDTPCRLAVIAMGKCGGRELNYVSDVDVIFVADRDAELAAATALALATMRIATQACFQVDAALRPEGKAGVLVRTVEGHLSYYRRWARTWEFQALLKARPVAGDDEIGQAYLDAVSPLVWTAADRDNFVPDVQAMRRRVEDNVPTTLAERELKLGRGGLRDVEFAVQLLQLVHGRSDVALRSPATMAALQALGEGGYVARADAAGLAESYRFLRTLEHRLQLRRLLRTHTVPAEDDRTGLRWLARAIGLYPEGGREAADVLLAELRRHRNRVRRLHEKLFYRPLLEAVARVPTEAMRLTTKEAAARLAALGYAAPDGALKHIKALTSGMTRRAAIQRTLLPVLLGLFAGTPDPDGGLLAYRRVSEALADTPWYLRLLRDEGAVVERLAKLLGTAKLVPDLLVRASEVLRLLTNTSDLAARDAADVAQSLRSAVARHTDPTKAVATARSLRRHELLRVACADLLGLSDVPTVCAALSGVWIAVLQSALDVALRSAAADRATATIAVIGMGRLGGRELGYGSDADVLFICEPINGATDADAVRYASVVAETTRRLLAAPSQDPALVVDMDLRPEGRSGPLVRTLASYQAYYAQWSQVWEAQALLRASAVAGDADLGRRFCEMVDPVRYPPGGLDATLIREVRRIKARVDAERLPRGADPATHTKLGRGGLADIEWTLQLLQLRWAGDQPTLRTTSTLEGLDLAARNGLLSPSDAESMTAAWLFATRARNAATLVRGKPIDQIPTSGRELAAVAAACGYPPGADPGEFLDDYRRTTRTARAVVERVFYDS